MAVVGVLMFERKATTRRLGEALLTIKRLEDLLDGASRYADQCEAENERLRDAARAVQEQLREVLR